MDNGDGMRPINREERPSLGVVVNDWPRTGAEERDTLSDRFGGVVRAASKPSAAAVAYATALRTSPPDVISRSALAADSTADEPIHNQGLRNLQMDCRPNLQYAGKGACLYKVPGVAVKNHASLMGDIPKVRADKCVREGIRREPSATDVALRPLPERGAASNLRAVQVADRNDGDAETLCKESCLRPLPRTLDA